MTQEIKQRIEMINRGEVPEGYKRTKVGVVPSEWEVKKLGKLSNVSSGATPNRSCQDYWNGQIPWVTTSQINFGFINSSNEYITELGFKESFTKILPKGTILMAMYGQGKTRGAVGILNIDATINQACAAISIKCDCIKYVFYYLIMNYLNIRNLSNTGSQENLNANIIKNLYIKLPSLHEQEKISGILTTCDKVIELKERLIAEKQTQKKWLMKSLLTGKKRLQGFKDKWVTVKFGNIVKEINVKTTTHNQHPSLTSSRKGIFLQEDYFTKAVASTDNSGYKIIENGQFTYRAMSDDGTYVFNKLYQYPIGLVSPAYSVFEENKQIADGDFIYYYINDYSFNKYLRILMQGGTRLSLKFNDLCELEVDFPSVSEQTAIANILTTADREIELMQMELAEWQNKKKTLMQLLLTGKVRV